METSLYETIKWFYEYNKYLTNTHYNEEANFYTWLLKHSKYIKDYDMLIKVYDMFNLDNYESILNRWRENAIEERKIDVEQLQNIMASEGFVFI